VTKKQKVARRPARKRIKRNGNPQRQRADTPWAAELDRIRRDLDFAQDTRPTESLQLGPLERDFLLDLLNGIRAFEDVRFRYWETVRHRPRDAYFRAVAVSGLYWLRVAEGAAPGKRLRGELAQMFGLTDSQVERDVRAEKWPDFWKRLAPQSRRAVIEQMTADVQRMRGRTKAGAPISAAAGIELMEAIEGYLLEHWPRNEAG
jgi:hypothetical protein